MFLNSSIEANCIWRWGRPASRASDFPSGGCCRINSSSCIAKVTRRCESAGVLDGEAGRSAATGNLVGHNSEPTLWTWPRVPKSGPKTAMRAPFLSAAQILATSDLVAVLPLNVAKTMTGSHPLAFHRLSRPPKPIEAAMIWLRRLDNQPAHAWLRDMILRVTNELRGDVRYP